MQKSLLAIAVVLGVMSSSGVAYSEGGPYVFGDAPYRLDFGPDPQVDSGCFKWNWQQHQWNDFCAVYVQPKAFMYPHRAAVRARG